MSSAIEILKRYQGATKDDRFHTTVISDAFRNVGAEVQYAGRYSEELGKSTFKMRIKFGCHEAFAFYASGSYEHVTKPSGLKMYNLLNSILTKASI